MYQGIRIFASNLKENMAQRFYNLVLLPRVRDDIDEYKKLNFHLYQALKKALFKPGAFMKGILIPLCEVGLMITFQTYSFFFKYFFLLEWYLYITRGDYYWISNRQKFYSNVTFSSSYFEIS